ncbi:D-arabinono-1,4-lactone oxidase [Rhodococcus koreensis]|uniref:D-arabinono-1,4-lactone oxidase n=1 Tax=Rhodococcus koreensis TaxID=99653 RepID=UPI0036DAE9A9
MTLTRIEQSTEHYRPWSNWAGNITSTPAITVTPCTDDDAVAAVRDARSRGIGVRVCGSSLSFSPLVATGGMLLDLRHLTGITGVDRDRQRVRVRAGTVIRDFAAELWTHGFSLANQGMIWNQTVGGAVGTSTHGTGRTLCGMSSMVTWVRLIDGRGEIVEIGEDEPDRLHAVQTALGVMGIFLEVEMAVVPAFYAEEKFRFEAWESAETNWLTNIDAHRNLSVMWLQSNAAAEAYSVPVPPGMSLANQVLHFAIDAIDPLPASEWCQDIGARRGPAYGVLSGENIVDTFCELEYMVPFDDGLVAVQRVQELLLGKHSDQLHPMFIRFIKADEAWMSPFYQRDTVTVSVAGHPGADYWPFFTDVDRILREYDARAHWGKLHLFDRDYLARVYPRHGDFVRLRKKMDPDGIFLNDHTRRLFG